MFAIHHQIGAHAEEGTQTYQVAENVTMDTSLELMKSVSASGESSSVNVIISTCLE